MTYTEILELIRAGYTRAEIDAMQKAEGSAPEAKPAASPEAKPAASPEAEPAAAPEPEQKQTTEQNKPESVPTPSPEKKEPTEVEKLVSALGLKIDRMTAAIQGRNITETENKTKELTPEQVVAQIINPHI